MKALEFLKERQTTVDVCRVIEDAMTNVGVTLYGPIHFFKGTTDEHKKVIIRKCEEYRNIVFDLRGKFSDWYFDKEPTKRDYVLLNGIKADFEAVRLSMHLIYEIEPDYIIKHVFENAHHECCVVTSALKIL